MSGPVGDNIAGWHIGVSRRALDGDGALRHVVVARITLDHFLQMFSTAPLGANGSVVLFRNDGLLLARSPFDGAVLGRNFSGMQLFTEKLQQAPSGVYEARSISDGQQRMIGYRQVQGFPLTLNATQLMDEVLAPFWLDLKRNLCFAALVAAVILGLGGLLAREGKKRERAERAEREQAILLRNTLDHMDEGLMMVDADKTVQVFNRRALELLELPEELIRSKPTFEAVLQHQRDGDEFAKSDATLRQWVQSSAAGEVYGLYERERPNGTVLEVRTVPLVEGGFVRTYTDVTPRKAAQCAVLQSEERYRVLAENTSDMLGLSRRRERRPGGGGRRGSSRARRGGARQGA